jgi:hypothetical protein
MPRTHHQGRLKNMYQAVKVQAHQQQETQLTVRIPRSLQMLRITVRLQLQISEIVLPIATLIHFTRVWLKEIQHSLTHWTAQASVGTLSWADSKAVSLILSHLATTTQTLQTVWFYHHMHRDLRTQEVLMVSEKVLDSKGQPLRCLNSSAAVFTINTPFRTAYRKTISSSKVGKLPLSSVNLGSRSTISTAIPFNSMWRVISKQLLSLNRWLPLRISNSIA